MNREDALSFIHETCKFGSKLGLENIGRLLNKLGNPQDKLNIIHIAGTNGKGSTASYIQSILIEDGYNIGIFTSPYLERFEERIRINDRLIEESKLVEGIEIIKNAVNSIVKEGGTHPTEFEVVTALGFWYFYHSNVDYVVLEVGLGGRFDATNIIKKPLISVVTSISFDHTAILGDTLEKIAFEKAGIFKENIPVVSFFQKNEVKNVLEEEAYKKNSNIKFLKKDEIIIQSKDAKGSTFIYKEQEYRTNLLGEHQIFNATLAIETIMQMMLNKDIEIKLESIINGVAKTIWPGRVEVLSEKPLFIIDGAHNVDGANALVSTINNYFKDKKIILLLGMLADKDIEKLTDIYAKFADEIFICEPDNPRAISKSELFYIVQKKNRNTKILDSNNDSINSAIKLIDENAVCIMTGSLYLIGDSRAYLRKIFNKKYEYKIN